MYLRFFQSQDRKGHLISRASKSDFPNSDNCNCTQSSAMSANLVRNGSVNVDACATPRLPISVSFALVFKRNIVNLILPIL